MGSIYRESGLANAPAFFNYTPFRLDFSPYRRNQEMMMQMMPMLLEQQRAAVAQAKADKMPELDALANDATPRYQQAREGEAIMQQRLASGMNPRWVVNYDEEFKRGQQMRLSAFLPEEQLRLKEEKAGLEQMEKTINDKKSHGAPSFLFTDGNGRVMTSPYDEAAPLTYEDAMWMRRHDPNSNIDSTGGNWDFRNALIGSPQDFKERLTKNMSTSAFNEWSSSGKHDMQALGQLAAATNQGMSSVLANVLQNGKGKSNREQLQTAIMSEIGSWDEEAKAAVRNEFIQQKGLTNEKGEPLYVDDKGKFDQSKLDKAIFNEESYTAPLLGKTSFAGRFVAQQAARHLGNSNLINPELVKSFAAGGDGSGSGSSMPKLIPLLEAIHNPAHSIDGEGRVRVHGKVEDSTFPLAVQKDGVTHMAAITIPGGQVTDRLNVSWVQEFNKDVRSATAQGKSDMDAIEKDSSVGDVQSVFNKRDMLTLGGRLVNTDNPGFQGAKILEVLPTITYRKKWDYEAASDPKLASLPREKGGLGVTYQDADSTSAFTPTYMDPKIENDQPLSPLDDNDMYLRVRVLLNDAAPEPVPEYARTREAVRGQKPYEPQKLWGPFVSHSEYLKGEASREESPLKDRQGNPVPIFKSTTVEDIGGEEGGATTDWTDHIPGSGMSDRVVEYLMKVYKSDEFMRGEKYMVDPDAVKATNPFRPQPSPQQAQQAASSYQQVVSQSAVPDSSQTQ